MTDYEFRPRGVCSRIITLSLDDENKIHNLKFQGGCPGNLSAIGRLLEGRDAKEAADILRGNDCAGKGTSCADQLARGLDEILAARKSL
ncbi:TIGR03905 family TSCPD domain-containing protein [uncultured Dialister sp.]|uniref:TIGR03905 family TSCPD domain-containing protein n=1 Tax=uncultured Dialister sp. TaxID=278064 RepID=UPI0025E49AF9|nr:TIGR03905 family TSCPD domain-containing protein [uncultured Dialister sp.]